MCPLPSSTPGASLHRPRGERPAGLARLRRLVGRTVTRTFEALRGVPPGGMLHRRLLAGLELTGPELHLARGHADLDGLRIAFVSDVHAGFFQTAADLGALARRIAREAPDLLLLGGDLVGTHGGELELFDVFLSLLTPPLGAFAIPGNHDCFYSAPRMDLWERFLEGRGVTVLCNRGVRIERGGATLWLAGVDDLEEGLPDLDAALTGRREDEPILLASHHPDLFVEAARRGIDAQLSGHTHGGQIRLLGRAPVTHSAHGFDAGPFERNGSHLYVGRGVGVSFLPLRIGAPPEVPIATLRVGPASSVRP